uniref:Uncharacterized protein n=1 Tax=Candidatus Kentrum sp. DK TaxID=2126562 RepID=A0A450RV09_9GAMM|nr:MAG: hypothetical protein BECKDK2373C_GA0170839_100272 [Candidatus Kentron sp. DK]
MLNTLWAVARKEKIELLEKVNIPEGTNVLVTLLTNKNEQHFWQGASQASLDAIWNNAEDDIYEQLLEK